MSEVTAEMIRNWIGGEDDGTILQRTLDTLSEIANGEYKPKLFASEVLMYNEEEAWVENIK